MKHKSFVVFILTHGRASNVKTLRTLKKAGYTGKVILVIDNEDEMESDYKRIYGKDNVYVFNKEEAMEQCDTMDNFEKHNIVLYARNKCWDIAKELGYKYFLVLDDDYTQIAFKVVLENKFKNIKVKNADMLFDIMLDYLDVTGAYTIAFAQGGDFIGGKDNKRYYEKILRKAMNSFFCKTNRRMQNMVINDLMDLIKKLFGDNYENIIVIDASDRIEHNADVMTVKELKSYDINKIDVITADEDKIYIIF